MRKNYKGCTSPVSELGCSKTTAATMSKSSQQEIDNLLKERAKLKRSISRQ